MKWDFKKKVHFLPKENDPFCNKKKILPSKEAIRVNLFAQMLK